MNYLFSRLQVIEGQPQNCYPWILWYIWKARNRKVFEDVDVDPPVIVEHAIKESKTWFGAQHAEGETKVIRSLNLMMDTHVTNSCVVCQVDGSWKNTKILEGIGWICSNGDGVCHLLGVRCERKSLSPLHAEFGALLCAMEVIQALNIPCQTFETDNTTLVTILQSPSEWPVFATMLAEFETMLVYFTQFNIKSIPRDRNKKADKLARARRALSSTIKYVNGVPPSWATITDKVV